MIALAIVLTLALVGWLTLASYAGYVATSDEPPMWRERKGMRPGIRRTAAAVHNLRQSSRRWLGTTAAGF